MTDSLRGALPPVYRPLLDDLFDGPKVEETRATCHECAMCDHGQPSPVEMEYFNPNTKCCTYFPNLPNYLVGAILADPSPEMAEGKRRIREVIAKRIGVMPGSLSRPRKLTLIMGVYGDAFGRAESLLCPYYDGSNPAGTCTIWKHREAICMTYHCKYSRGQHGFEFWRALKVYLGAVQHSLSARAMKAVDERVIQPRFKEDVLSVEDIDEVPPKEAEYARWWGPWVGREEEFYVKCFEWAEAMSRADFRREIDGKDAKKEREALAVSYGALQNLVLPKHLVRSARMTEDHKGDTVVVTTYHRYDSFALDKDLYEVIGLLRADETLDENLARIEEETGAELAPELLEYLFMQGILVDPTKKKAAKVKPGEAGERKGRRAALAAILRARGLTIDHEAQTRIDAADSPTLDGWIRKAANAVKLSDVFGGAAGGSTRPSRRKRRR